MHYIEPLVNTGYFPTVEFEATSFESRVQHATNCMCTMVLSDAISLAFNRPIYTNFGKLRATNYPSLCSKIEVPRDVRNSKVRKQVKERLVSKLEHMQVPNWDMTGYPEA